MLDWRGWWGDTAPPGLPPGDPTAAASEQWTGWSWPAKSSSWSPGGWSRAEGWGPNNAPDKKNVEKPDKYSGDITRWLRWSSAFTRFLKKLDDRWPKTFGKLEQLKGMPVTSQVEEAIAWELWASDLMLWEDKLFPAARVLRRRRRG